MRAYPEANTEPDQALGYGVVDDAANDDMRAQPGAVSKQAGELGARPDARRHVVAVGRLQDHEARHELAEGGATEHSRGNFAEGEEESALAQLDRPPFDELGQLERRRFGEDPGDLSRRSPDLVGCVQGVEPLVLKNMLGQGQKEERGARVQGGREGVADEMPRVHAHRPTGESLIAEHRAVLQIHHRLQRDKSRQVR